MKGEMKIMSKRRREKDTILERGSSRSRNQGELGMDLCQVVKLGAREDQRIRSIVFITFCGGWEGNRAWVFLTRKEQLCFWWSWLTGQPSRYLGCLRGLEPRGIQRIYGISKEYT